MVYIPSQINFDMTHDLCHICVHTLYRILCKVTYLWFPDFILGLMRQTTTNQAKQTLPYNSHI